MATTLNEKFLTHVPQWEETKARFNAWWNRSSLGRPMINLKVPRQTRLAPEIPVAPRDDVPNAERYLDVDAIVKRARNRINATRFLGESYPSLDLNLGPGSIALYLGSEPEFAPRTVWFKEVVHNWETHPELRFDPANHWLKTHLDMMRRAVELADGEFMVNIPDLIENVDILSAMRGPQPFCFDLIDTPEAVQRHLTTLNPLYLPFYDAFHNIVKTPDNAASFTVFAIWGPGRTAKVQCDFSALMSPSQFREFVLPGLQQQCAELDFTLYHLDGPDAIKHLDAVMEIKDLDALQWCAGAGKPDDGDECWNPIHDKVKAAGKSLWIYNCVPSYEAAIATGDRLVNRYGADGLYLHFEWDNATEEQGLRLMDHADKYWR